MLITRRLRKLKLIAGIAIGTLVSIVLIASRPQPRTFSIDNLKIEPCVDCPGEMGKAVTLSPSERGEHNVSAAMKTDYFNYFVSAKISLWRSLPDVRHPKCKRISYDLSQLPTASVILIFKNERFSILIRTVYSILLRSPKQNLKEIVLVDDQSELDELKQDLDDYCEKHFGDLVKIYRAPRRLGLIQAKNYGARRATGDVIVFLDAHCEANAGWLEPILFRLKQNPKSVVCPIIDTIDAETFEYRGGQIPHSIGGFSWSMLYSWISIPERLKSIAEQITEPIPSPTMAGGLLAASRKEFFEFGAYDDGMEVWGAENLEISFRTWMCGGSVEFIPCSHVGHVFRSGHPYNMTGDKSGKNPNGMNAVRLVEVWLDDHKRHFYRQNKNLLHQFKDKLDLEDRRKIRRDLNCKDFSWFLKTVIPEKLIPDQNTLAHGTIKNAETGLCIDTISSPGRVQFVSVFPWQSGGSNNQYFSFYLNNRICIEDMCLAVKAKNPPAEDGDQIGFAGQDSGSHWSYRQETQQIVFGGQSKGDLCVSVEGLKAKDPLLVRKCDANNVYQKFILENYRVEN